MTLRHEHVLWSFVTTLVHGISRHVYFTTLHDRAFHPKALGAFLPYMPALSRTASCNKLSSPHEEV